MESACSVIYWYQYTVHMIHVLVNLVDKKMSKAIRISNADTQASYSREAIYKVATRHSVVVMTTIEHNGARKLAREPSVSVLTRKERVSSCHGRCC